MAPPTLARTSGAEPVASAPRPGTRSDAQAPRSQPVAQIVVGIPSLGRPLILRDTLLHLATQSRLPDRVLVCITCEDDLSREGLDALPFQVEVLLRPRGLARQRNALLASAGIGDVLLFLDDDFLMAPDYIARLADLFAAEPGVVMATGTVIADGILGAGLDHAQGLAVLAAAGQGGGHCTLAEVRNGYGCNMALRVAAARRADRWFDERLVQYGWLEDVDFSRALAPQGRIVRASALRGVHLGTRTGRSRDRPLGYSQMVNPVYLWRKGTLGLPGALWIMSRNLCANLLKSLRPEPWVDRRGRLAGNLLGLGHLATGRAAPERIGELA